MKKTKKFGLQILLLALMVFTLFGCGTRSTDSSSSPNDETDLEETSAKQPDDKDDAESQSQHGENMEVIDELWEKLDGVWDFKELRYMGKTTMYDSYTLEFQYIDNTPCIVKITPKKDESIIKETFVYEGSVLDEYHYKAYVYKKDSYNGTSMSFENNNGIALIWYEFDLTNISNGEVLISYNVSGTSSDNVDTQLSVYHKED
ncbi:MAG: hypothetical protein NC231_01700 [Bacillus sp. (in: Bacteria)]|nr:hypothetical protein [Bacillus sp. (in: firmicutes)]MCM1425028.1 hypothetical protein [Eubacterium sp.]